MRELRVLVGLRRSGRLVAVILLQYHLLNSLMAPGYDPKTKQQGKEVLQGSYKRKECCRGSTMENCCMRILQEFYLDRNVNLRGFTWIGQ